MPKDPWGRQDHSKKRQQTGDLAGAVAQDLRDRSHCLPCLSKRQTVQGCASQPTSMQQPTGVIEMMTACNQQTLPQVSCEKNTLFRHVILLPKNVHSYLSRPSAAHSITMLAPILTGIGTKRGNKALYSPGYRQKKQERYD